MSYQLFVLEIEKHNGKKELHGCGAGGIPGVTAQQVVSHLQKLGHYNRIAKRVVIKHRGEILKATASNIHRVTEDQLPKVEVHEGAEEAAPTVDSQHPQPNLGEGKPLPLETVEGQQDQDGAAQFAEPDLEMSRRIDKALGGPGNTLTK